MDRASGYEPEGWGFESLRARHCLTRMFHVYVLRSMTTGRHYVGHTTDVDQRVGQHNHGITKSTRNRGPWELVHQENFPSKAEAVRRERFLKTGKGREHLRTILQERTRP